MPRIAFIIYRQWAFDIFARFNELNTGAVVPLICTTKSPEFDDSAIPQGMTVEVVEGIKGESMADLFRKHQIDVACFFGWSLMVEPVVHEQYLCLCLHPSALPQFRGGSPIQNQIIRGVLDSQVSIFKIADGIDNGDIYKQYPLSLKGELGEIFEQMTNAGVKAMVDFTFDYQNNLLSFTKQTNLEAHPTYKRRKEHESELVKENLTTMTGLEFSNFVRALSDPYPNAFVKIGSNHVLLKKVGRLTQTCADAVLLNDLSEPPISSESLCVRVKDGFIPVTNYEVV